jgi:hypothetical protein
MTIFEDSSDGRNQNLYWFGGDNHWKNSRESEAHAAWSGRFQNPGPELPVSKVPRAS